MDGKYKYCICQPKKTKGILKYHTYYSPVIKKFLEESPDWSPTTNKKISHFCDCNPAGKVKCRLALRAYIFDKVVLAQILRNTPVHPPTFIIRGGRIQDSRLSRFLKEDTTGQNKWFLKPAMSGGGQGIQVLSRLRDFPKYVKPFRQYVIQRGVPCVLYQGKKFDLRSYLLVVVDEKKARVYLSKDSCLRISSYLYDDRKLDKGINVTNLCYQKHEKGEKNPYRNSLSMSLWEHYPQVFPRMLEAIREIGGQIDPYIVRRKTVALLGCDFLVDPDLKPHFLEINVNIGFSIHIRPPETGRMLTEMIQEIIQVGYLPLIRNQEPPEESRQWKRAY